MHDWTIFDQSSSHDEGIAIASPIRRPTRRERTPDNKNWWEAHNVFPIFCTVEMDHTIQTGEGGIATLPAMGIQLLLGEDVAATLFKDNL